MDSSIAIIKKKGKSFWVSCQSITQNLHKSYLNAFPGQELKCYEYDNVSNDYEVWKVAKKIFEDKPDKLVFIDHTPHPARLLQCLWELYDNKLPALYFHVFGDFTLNASLWAEIEPILLKSQNTTFVCASEKQSRMIKRLMNDSENLVHTIPFPVDSSYFNFDENLMKETRSKFNFSDDEFIFLYTGRLSFQKKVLELISVFSNYVKNINPKAQLLIAGEYDDLGNPFLGQGGMPGDYFQRWIKRLQQSKKIGVDHHIHYLGNLPILDLKEIYNASDCFVSYSTHNDEDYGMSCAEALACGVPLNITDWGGFSSFAQISPKFCHLVPVNVEKNCNSPHLNMALKKMILVSRQRVSIGDRKKISKAVVNSISIEAVTEKVLELHNKMDKIPNPFKGYSKNFNRLSLIFKDGHHAVFRAPNGNYTTFYHEIYQDYYN